MQYIITIRLRRNPDHDPQHKVTGPCPVGPGPLSGQHPLECTDVTGEHHSFLWEAPDIEQAKRNWQNLHITRIEEVG